MSWMEISIGLAAAIFVVASVVVLSIWPELKARPRKSRLAPPTDGAVGFIPPSGDEAYGPSVGTPIDAE